MRVPGTSRAATRGRVGPRVEGGREGGGGRGHRRWCRRKMGGRRGRKAEARRLGGERKKISYFLSDIM